MNTDKDGIKKALAAGVLGLGAAGSVGANSEGGRTLDVLQAPSQVLVFAYDYNPGLPFEVVSLLQQQTVNNILGQSVGDDGDQVVNDPTDYNGYVVQYQSDDNSLGEYTLVFVRENTLNTGDTYEFSPGNATFFNSQVNLLQAGLDSGDGDGEETPTEEDEETTPEETTPEETTPEETTPEETTPANETEEVVVDTTTPENGGG